MKIERKIKLTIKLIKLILRWCWVTLPRRIFSSLVIALLVGAPLSFLLFKTPTAEAAWWNDSWSYRKSVEINNSGSKQSNVYVSTTIDTSASGRFKSNCGDLRFTKENGELLPYYISSGCGTASTVVHVSFDVLPAGVQTIYYYYGNPNAPDGFLTTNFSTQASSYAVGTIGAEEVGTGPVAYWSFDEGYGTTAFDGTTNRNNGTLTNMSSTASSTSGWQTEDNCVSGKCLAFDGGKDYVLGSKAISFGTSNFSVSFWINARGNNSYGAIFDEGGPMDANHSGYMMFLSSGKLRYNISDGAGNWQELVVGNSPDLRDNKWHHVVWAYDGSSSRFYLDNILLDTDAWTYGSGSPTAAFKIGNSWMTKFLGRIDEIKIYNYARTAAQIKMDYNAGLAGTSGRAAGEGAAVAVGARSAQWFSNGLVGWWKMDEAVGTWNGTAGEVIDYSGNGNNGTATGNASTTAGYFGNGGIFDGTDDSLSVSSFNLGTNVNWGVWIKLDSLPSSGNFFGIINKDDNGSNRVLQTKINPTGTFDTYYWGASSYDSVTSATTLSTNTWYHLVSTYDGTTAKIYVNGVLNSSKVFAVGNLTDKTTTIYIGSFLGNSRYLDGQIDEARIYRRALSDREIRDLYSYAPGPVGWWKMEEGSGTTLYDSSGRGNSGSAGTCSRVAGKFGKGEYCSSSNSFNLTSNTDLDSSQFTIETWIKINQFHADPGGWGANANVIMYKEHYTVEGFRFGLNTSGAVYFWATQSGGSLSVNSGSNYVKQGDFYHLAITYDPSGNAKLYINGVLVGSGSGTYNVPVGHGWNINWGPGCYSPDATYDEIKFYNYPRTQKQIVEDMNAGHPAAGSPVGSQVGYWKFDEGYGTTANDSSPQKNNATTTNMASPATAASGWTNNGIFGKALRFDGTDDYVSAASNASLKIDGDLTLSAWVYTNLATTGYIVGKGSGNDYYQMWYLRVNSDGALEFIVGNAASNGYGIDLTTTDKISANAWHHLVATISSTTATIYIDGKLSKTGTVSSRQSNDGYVYIGRRVDAWAPLTGLIDEVKIYNYALTADEIKLDYNRGSSLKLGSFSQSSTGVASSSAASIYCVPGSTDACSPPVGEWKFEEGSGASAFDTSGNGNTGTISGATRTAGKFGKALKFDGSDDYVDVGSGSSLDMSTTDKMTFSMWVKPTNYPSGSIVETLRQYDNMLMSWRGDVGDYWQIGVRQSNGNAKVSEAASSANIPINKWTFVELTADGSNVRLYINGVFTGSAVYDGTLGGIGSYSTIIGAYRNNGARSFPGYIDDVKIFNYARTASQVAWDYNRGGPVGWWKMDECQGSTIHDSSGFGNNGTWSGAAGGTQTTVGTCASSTPAGAWYNGRTGKRNASLNFDGTDDYIDVATSTVYQFNTNSFALSAWVKTSSAGGYIINRYDYPNGTDSYYYLYLSSGKPYFAVRESIAAGSHSASVYSATSINNNAWHHVVGVRDASTNTIYIYVDGVLKGSVDSSAVGDVVNTGQLNIGANCTRAYYYGCESYFTGQIDDVQIFKYALTPIQIKNLYSGGAVRFGQ